MYQFWVEEAGEERLRQELGEGRFHLGRSQENEITLASPYISRRHLQLEIRADRVLVTDLGSANGARLNGRALSPHQPVVWPPEADVHIGPLRLRLRPMEERRPEAVPESPAASLPLAAGPLLPRIVSGQTQPQITFLEPGTIFIGSDASCAIRLLAANVAPHHCRLTYDGGRLEVTNLDNRSPVILNGQPLPPHESRPWPPNQSLQIGSGSLFMSLMPADQAGQTAAYKKTGRSLQPWRLALGGAAAIGFFFFCLVSVLLAYGMLRGSCDRFGLDCLAVLLADDAVSFEPDSASGLATPTIAAAMPAPTLTPTATRLPQIIATQAASVAADCLPGEIQRTAGWLDLPFPYQGTAEVFGGTAEQFQLISRRSRVGGRINSFFDHEYPVYPPQFGGWEPPETADTMVIFTGNRVADALSQDAADAYWYSGHTGIDYAPAVPREATTPVLAAADGLLYRAEIDTDGNHMVWLIHDPDGDNSYLYATLYFHLHPDHHFERMVALLDAEGQAPIAAGERIGTMGTTGRSTGIHLHFEVRRRAHSNALFTRMDTIDPYGFVPSAEFPHSPWEEEVAWIDAAGNERRRAGGPIEYLWKHPLSTIEDERSADLCPPPAAEAPLVSFEVDIFPLIGYSVINPGFTFIARDEAGNVLDYSITRFQREMVVTLEDLERGCTQIGNVNWHFLAPGEGQRWTPFAAPRPVRDDEGNFVFRSWIEQTGRYILAARQTRDCLPPQTGIRLSGERLDDDRTFQDEVTVRLEASDIGFPMPSGVRETLYSLDCGQTWVEYDGQPFTVTLDTPRQCGEDLLGEQGITLAPNQFVLLASSIDNNNNIEEPPAQVRFTIISE